ncbi:hypothetical protein POTOM_055308 [Populus tomentosa]|uniref:Small ribosomal subunit protein eS4 N-terminal domain-containing protein n=1 Tax=Populus tomentosa TaxID=118781 RepID=A0A8X8BZ29_POPTO|nr:hypothetical protein POTOM_055308 [Populus tomentosa]
MARGWKKHLKRINAPKHWMLEKLGGAFARKPSSGPHKSRECLPPILILRNRLKYALTYREVIAILMQRHVLVDGKHHCPVQLMSFFIRFPEETVEELLHNHLHPLSAGLSSPLRLRLAFLFFTSACSVFPLPSLSTWP